eukprot:UN04534
MASCLRHVSRYEMNSHFLFKLKHQSQSIIILLTAYIAVELFMLRIMHMNQSIEFCMYFYQNIVYQANKNILNQLYIKLISIILYRVFIIHMGWLVYVWIKYNWLLWFEKIRKNQKKSEENYGYLHNQQKIIHSTHYKLFPTIKIQINRHVIGCIFVVHIVIVIVLF